MRSESKSGSIFRHSLEILPAGENVIIEVSRDGGTTWDPPIATVPATPSSYNWTVTGPPSTTCLIRASWAANPDSNDVSNVNFRIN